MRYLTLLVAPLCVCAAAAEPEGDLKALQGTWVIGRATLAGRDHTDDFKGMKLTVGGEKYSVGFGAVNDNGTLKLDAAKQPPHIDLTTRPDGPFKGRTLPGIYELKGDTIVLCLNSEKPDRPTKFEAPEKSKLMLLTFKRDKRPVPKE
jgi:uncharacterized protein (TIGR03067 family)